MRHWSGYKNYALWRLEQLNSSAQSAKAYASQSAIHLGKDFPSSPQEMGEHQLSGLGELIKPTRVNEELEASPGVG